MIGLMPPEGCSRFGTAGRQCQWKHMSVRGHVTIAAIDAIAVLCASFHWPAVDNSSFRLIASPVDTRPAASPAVGLSSRGFGRAAGLSAQPPRLTLGHSTPHWEAKAFAMPCNVRKRYFQRFGPGDA